MTSQDNGQIGSGTMQYEPLTDEQWESIKMIPFVRVINGTFVGFHVRYFEKILRIVYPGPEFDDGIEITWNLRLRSGVSK